MMYSLFISPCKSTIEHTEPKDMSGNTDWYWMELDDETAAKLTERNLNDDHGAAYYKMVDGNVVERTEEERQAEWQPEPEPEATVDDYREMLRGLGVDV